MGPKQIHVEGWSPAPPDAVFAVVADAVRWPEWGPMDEATLEEEGTPAPDGIGALRRFRTGRTTSRERVVAYEPGHRFSYELVSGLPLRDYRADVDLAPTDGGTTITWHSTFRPKVPGTGWLYRAVLRVFIRRLLDALVAHTATRRTDATPGPDPR